MCVLVCPSCVASGTCWLGVRCGGVLLGLGCCRALPLLAWVLGRVRVCVCAPLVRRFSWGCEGVAVGGVCPPPSRLVFFWGGALWCRSLVAPVLGSVVSVPPSFLFRAALFVVCFFSPWCVSACFGCPFSRWAAVLGLVLPVWAGSSPSAPFGGPGFGAVSVGGLAASCGVGGRCGGCGPFSRPPPLFFFLGGVFLFPPLPSLGWRTHWSAFCVAFQFAVGGCVLPGCPGPMGRLGYVHVGLGAPSCRVRFRLCLVGGCARRLRVALG